MSILAASDALEAREPTPRRAQAPRRVAPALRLRTPRLGLEVDQAPAIPARSAGTCSAISPTSTGPTARTLSGSKTATAQARIRRRLQRHRGEARSSIRRGLNALPRRRFDPGGAPGSSRLPTDRPIPDTPWRHRRARSGPHRDGGAGQALPASSCAPAERSRRPQAPLTPIEPPDDNRLGRDLETSGERNRPGAIKNVFQEPPRFANRLVAV